VADLAAIRTNDSALNISRYVDTTKHEDVMNVAEALAQLPEADGEK